MKCADKLWSWKIYIYTNITDLFLDFLTDTFPGHCKHSLYLYNIIFINYSSAIRLTLSEVSDKNDIC